MQMRALLIGAVLAASALMCGGCGRELKMTTSSDEALRAYTQGVTEWERFYYAEAEASLKRALTADSSFAAAWARLAFLHSTLGNDADARRESAHALALSSSVTEYEGLLIRLIRYRILYDNARAAHVADSLIALYPGEPEAFLVRGQLYEGEKNIEAAVKMYEMAVKADTGFAPAVMSLGYAYSNLGEQDKAVAYMQRYIQMAPGVADPRASYADVLMRAGRYADALEQYQASLKLKPDYWYAVGQTGRVYAVMGRLNDAGRELDRSYQMVPQSRSVDAQRLRVHASLDVQRGAYESAVAKYREAITLDSSVAAVGYNLTYALAKLKRFAEAHDYIDRTLEELREKHLGESPTMQGYHLMRARVLTEERRFEEAQDACRAALEYSSPLMRGAVYVQMARIFIEERQYDPAFDAIEGALGVNPNAPDALLLLVHVYHQQGDRRMTREVGERLLELWKNADPDFLPAAELRRVLGIPRKTSAS
jgi:tetratricopeptide (TPR) repeat protein